MSKTGPIPRKDVSPLSAGAKWPWMVAPEHCTDLFGSLFRDKLMEACRLPSADWRRLVLGSWVPPVEERKLRTPVAPDVTLFGPRVVEYLLGMSPCRLVTGSGPLWAEIEGMPGETGVWVASPNPRRVTWEPFSLALPVHVAPVYLMHRNTSLALYMPCGSVLAFDVRPWVVAPRYYDQVDAMYHAMYAMRDTLERPGSAAAGGALPGGGLKRA